MSSPSQDETLGQVLGQGNHLQAAQTGFAEPQQFPLSMDVPENEVNMPNGDDILHYTAFNTPQASIQPQAPLAQVPQQQLPGQGQLVDNTTFPCTHPSCTKTFRRIGDLKRHLASVHRNPANPLYFCHIQGCNKSFGQGYTRADKLTEHMWRKHADLGYVKATRG